MSVATVGAGTEKAGRGRRVLATACGAHALHDGFVDVLYVLLPVWQAQFGLSLAEVGFLRSVYSGTMAAFQIPAGRLSERVGERGLLALGTLLAACGFVVAGQAAGFAVLALCLALIGLGASVQHPLGSALTSGAFSRKRLRTALSTYNFSGDVGKVVVPALAAGLLGFAAWPVVTDVLAALGLVGAVAIWLALGDAHGKAAQATTAHEPAPARLPPAEARRGFVALSAIGIVDSATRMGFLTLLPFLLVAKGAPVTTVGLALSLVFAGGAAGKFVCGVIAARVGVIRSILMTEAATAVGMAAVPALDLAPTLMLLPALGVALNGTSSVVYGTVGEIAPAARRARAFGLFYTLSIGAGAIAPFVYGAVADQIGLQGTVLLACGVVLLTLPLTLPLGPAIRRLHG
jgi:MFS family permease